jgi:hypothetical protein
MIIIIIISSKCSLFSSWYRLIITWRSSITHRVRLGRDRIWWLDLQLPMQSVPITTDIVSSNPTTGTSVSSTNKTDRHDITKILSKGVKHYTPLIPMKILISSYTNKFTKLDIEHVDIFSIPNTKKKQNQKQTDKSTLVKRTKLFFFSNTRNFNKRTNVWQDVWKWYVVYWFTLLLVGSTLLIFIGEHLGSPYF